MTDWASLADNKIVKCSFAPIWLEIICSFWSCLVHWVDDGSGVGFPVLAKSVQSLSRFLLVALSAEVNTPSKGMPWVLNNMKSSSPWPVPSWAGKKFKPTNWPRYWKKQLRPRLLFHPLTSINTSICYQTDVLDCYSDTRKFTSILSSNKGFSLFETHLHGSFPWFHVHQVHESYCSKVLVEVLVDRTFSLKGDRYGINFGDKFQQWQDGRVAQH